LGSYTGCLRQTIRDLKYRRRLRLRGHLAHLLAQRIEAGDDEGGENGKHDVVLAVPMHWLRRMGRGFDHARAIAKALARELSLPLGCELIRIRNTPGFRYYGYGLGFRLALGSP